MSRVARALAVLGLALWLAASASAAPRLRAHCEQTRRVARRGPRRV
jgi:hypothetical protein